MPGTPIDLRQRPQGRCRSSRPVIRLVQTTLHSRKFAASAKTALPNSFSSSLLPAISEKVAHFAKLPLFLADTDPNFWYPSVP
jgi:hypothetical protein